MTHIDSGGRKGGRRGGNEGGQGGGHTFLQLFFPSYNEQPGPLEKQFYPHLRSRIMSK